MPADASAVSRIESGERSVRLVEAFTIARVLGCSMADLCWQFDAAPETARTVPVLQQAIDELERIKRLMIGSSVGDDL